MIGISTLFFGRAVREVSGDLFHAHYSATSSSPNREYGSDRLYEVSSVARISFAVIYLPVYLFFIFYFPFVCWEPQVCSIFFPFFVLPFFFPFFSLPVQLIISLLPFSSFRLYHTLSLSGHTFWIPFSSSSTVLCFQISLFLFFRSFSLPPSPNPPFPFCSLLFLLLLRLSLPPSYLSPFSLPPSLPTKPCDCYYYCWYYCCLLLPRHHNPLQPLRPSFVLLSLGWRLFDIILAIGISQILSFGKSSR